MERDDFFETDDAGYQDISAAFKERLATAKPFRVSDLADQQAVVRDITISGEHFRQLDLAGLVFTECRFRQCAIAAMKWTTAGESITFVRCEFEDCEFHHGPGHFVFRTCSLRRGAFGVLRQCHVLNCLLLNVRLPSEIDRVDFSHTILSRCDLSEINFVRCSIEHGRFDDVYIDSSTRFTELTETAGFSMTRLQLAHLQPTDYGGLTPGQRSRMDIRDDVGRLRKAFGGIWFWLHWVALISFAFPYIIFIAIRYLSVLLNPETGSGVYMFQSLAIYVLSGKRQWHGPEIFFDYFAIVTTVVYVAYNVIRLLLVMITLRLEQEERISGVPADFELPDVDSLKMNRPLWFFGLPPHAKARPNEWVLRLLFWYKWFFVFGILSAMYHLYLFLIIVVPIQ